jgi:predicted DNA-binding transcriptional regulator AlpA
MANATAAKATSILPRFIRFGDAPGYLGMCRDEFNKTVRPGVREFPIGKQGVAFDRHELDEWADAYIAAKAIEKAANQDNNRPRSERQGATRWREKQSSGSIRRGLADRQRLPGPAISRKHWHS